MAELVRARDGVPISAPAMVESPLDPGPDVVELISRLRREDLDAILFLTRGGVEALPQATRSICSNDELVAFLRKLPLGARGPKTRAALTKLIGEGEGEIVLSDRPHRWQGLLEAMDRAHPLGGSAVAIIEHGVEHGRLRSALIDRGASPLSVALYRWVLPDDIEPITDAITRLVDGKARVALFTSGAQIDGVMGVAAEQDLDEPLLHAFSRVLVGAVGHVTAERLRSFGVEADFVPMEARMEDLVRDAAGRAADFLGED
jgi:uroporphyrinogen-III synthase